MNKKCICVLCRSYNEINDIVIKQLQDNIKDYKNDTDLWLLYDIGDYNPHRDEVQNFINKGYNIWIFDYYQMKECYTPIFYGDTKEGRWYYEGNTQWPFFDFCLSHNYEYYMFYEDDSICTKNVNQLFEEIISEKHDIYFMEKFTEFYKTDEDYPWRNRPDLVPEEYLEKFHGVIFKHVLNMFIITKQSINKMIDIAYKLKWSVHHQSFIPCTAYYLDMDINFFGDKFKYFMQNWIWFQTKHYVVYLRNNKKELDNSFFHPVKDLETYNLILSTINKDKQNNNLP